jgi:hypothetical protein
VVLVLCCSALSVGVFLRVRVTSVSGAQGVPEYTMRQGRGEERFGVHERPVGWDQEVPV